MSTLFSILLLEPERASTTGSNSLNEHLYYYCCLLQEISLFTTQVTEEVEGGLFCHL